MLGGARYASATTFVDLSALTGSYYKAYPEGINSGGEVSLEGYSAAHTTNYYDTYLYAGGVMNLITSQFGTTTSVNSMNAAGQMAVYALAGGYNNYGILYSGGTSGSVTSYKYSGNNTFALAIDSSGDEGGFYASSIRYPVVYTGGTACALNTPTGDSYTSGGAGIVALNANGQAVGFTTPGNPGVMQGAVWTYTISGGVVISQTGTDIKSLVQAQFSTANSSELLAINSSGTAVGVWSTGASPSINNNAESGAFLDNVANSTVTSLGTFLVGLPLLSASSTYGGGRGQIINDSGEVAGCTPNSNNTIGGGYDAAIYQGGTVTDLNSTYAALLQANGNFVLDMATAIDNNGDVAGYGHDANSHTIQAFVIMNTVPEPGALGLMAAGLVGLLNYAWRNRK